MLNLLKKTIKLPLEVINADPFERSRVEGWVKQEWSLLDSCIKQTHDGYRFGNWYTDKEWKKKKTYACSLKGEYQSCPFTLHVWVSPVGFLGMTVVGACSTISGPCQRNPMNGQDAFGAEVLQRIAESCTP